MKLSLKRTVIGLALGCSLLSATAIAAPVHSYGYGFRVPAYRGTKTTTDYAKTDASAKCWIWVEDEEGGSYAIDCYLEGANDRARHSEYAVVDQGWQKSMSCIGTVANPNVKYHMVLQNHSTVSYDAMVSGYWDTDWK